MKHHLSGIVLMILIALFIVFSGCIASEDQNIPAEHPVENQSPSSENDFDYLNFLGFDAMSKGDYTLALKYFNEVSDLNKTNPLVLNNIGYTYYLLGNYNESIKYFQEAIKNDPSDVMYYYNIAGVFESMGDYPQQRKYHDMAIGIDPGSDVYINFDRDPTINKANIRLSEQIAVNPKNSEIFIELAKKSIKGYDFEKAEYYFNQAEMALGKYQIQDNLDSLSLNNYGVILAFNKKDKEAIEAFEKAIQEDPTNQIIQKNKQIIEDEITGRLSPRGNINFNFEGQFYEIDTKINWSTISFGRKVLVS